MTKSNIVIIGFMGTGKTSVGRKIAQILNMEFVDTDALIEKKLMIPIPEIFAKYGEEFFREKESEIIREIINKAKAVIATGGGIVLNPENMKALGSKGIIVWLKAPVELMYERIKNDEGRPLSYNKSMRDIQTLYAKRYGLYEKYSDITVEVSAKSVEEIAKEIISYYKNMSF